MAVSHPPRLNGESWLQRAATQAIFAALAARGFVGRAVGGAVRNALLGLPVSDVDIATTARPDEVIAAAEAAGRALDFETAMRELEHWLQSGGEAAPTQA